jgi:hypothetical protein
MPIATVIRPSCQWPKVATGKRCSHLPIATVNLNICNFLLIKFIYLYDMKYVNNICVQIDTSVTSSYK